MRNEKSIIHCCVEREVYDMLSEHCEKTGQTKTTAVKRAIRAYCGDIAAAAHPEKGPGAGVPDGNG